MTPSDSCADLLIRRPRRLAWAAAPVLALGLLAGCSSSSDTSTDAGASSTTTAAPGTSSTTTPEDPEEPTVLFDESVQTQLKEVGCYTGAVDGIVGPGTDAAIVAFQTAQGLLVDGELGPETDTALDAAASKKVVVCTGSTTTTTARSGGTTTTAKSGGATTTTAKSSTSTTNPNENNPGYAPCTATAIAANMAPNTLLQTYVCVGQWSAGSETPPGGAKTTFIRQSVNDVWVTPSASPCGTPNLPPAITEHGCN